MCLFYEFQTFNIKADVHGGSIKEDIVVDLQKKLLTVNVGSVAHLNSDCPSTINLHDFKKVLYYLHKIGVTCIITCWFAVELYLFMNDLIILHHCLWNITIFQCHRLQNIENSI